MDAGALGKEVGAGPLKLPIWGWLIAGVGGVYVAKKITAKQAASAGGSSDTTSADTSTTGTGLPGGGALTVGSNGALGVPNGALSPVATTITDNDAWRIAAEQALVAGGYSGLLADSAVAKYLNGAQLTTQEAGAINYVLTRIGPTPTPVPPPVSAPPKPVPSPSPAPKPTPSIQQTSPQAPKPALTPNHAPGEAFVDFANVGKGTVWLTNWGGVYAVGGAPFKGAPIGARVSKQLGPPPAGQSFVSIDPLGANGYIIHDNRTDTGDYAYP